MCEFCNDPASAKRNHLHGGRDVSDPSFAGYFTPDAIESCLRAARADSTADNNNNNNSRTNNNSGGGKGRGGAIIDLSLLSSAEDAFGCDVDGRSGDDDDDDDGT